MICDFDDINLGGSYDSNEFNIGLLAPVRDPFLEKLQNKNQDDNFNNEARAKRIRLEAEKRGEYVYNLSHSRSIGYVSRAAGYQLFQGSSLNRDKKPKKQPEAVQKTAEVFNGDNASSAAASKITGIRRLKALHSGKQLAGNSLSRRTRYKIKDKILALYSAAYGSANKKGFRQQKIGFHLVTLTFIQKISEQTGKSILNKFFTQLKAKYGNFNYIWVAEKQGNGNIHFHIITDRRFNLYYINSLWTAQQLRSGLIDYDKEFSVMEAERVTTVDLHNAGLWRSVQKYYNPVDIKKVSTIEGVSAYLTNYVLKNESTFYCGGLWHSNRGVSRLFTKKIVSRNIFDLTGNSNINRVTSIKKKEYINTTYFAKYCIINSIYNKSFYRRFVQDMDLINRYILNIPNIDTDLIKNVNHVSNIELRELFLTSLN